MFVTPRQKPILTSLELVGDERGHEIERSELLGLRLPEADFEDIGHPREPKLAKRVVGFDEGSLRVSCSAIDEIAIEGELADQGIDLP